jgi:hypothetical protein
MDTSISHNIKHRQSPNDVFYTPPAVVDIHLSMIEHYPGDTWLDPFKGKGAYFDKYPSDLKNWCEISEGRDFFAYNEQIDVIVSNPPYSLIDDVLEHSVELGARVISYLIGQNNLTARRIEYMNKKGYGLAKLHMTKIYKWYGLSYIVVFEKGASNCISYDRVVHR